MNIKIRYFCAIVVISSLTFIIQGCKKGNKETGQDNPITTPATLTITSVSVQSGIYNADVIITGKKFGATADDNKLFFNGKAAVIRLVKKDTLYTNVPLAAGTGKITLTVNGVTAEGPVFTYQLSKVVSTFSGGTVSGHLDGQGTAASFLQPRAITIDAAGNFYIADTENHLIRKMTPAGLVSTLAGSGMQGNANGNGKEASFGKLIGICADKAGNVYVSDLYTNLIKKITPEGQVTTFAGNSRSESVDGTGTSASFSGLQGLAIDQSGNIFAADQGSGKIRKITPAGVVTTLAKVDYSPYFLTVDKAGNIYATTDADDIYKVTPQGVVSLFLKSSNGPTINFHFVFGIATDANDNLLIADTGESLLKMASPAGVITTVAGGGIGPNFDGPALKAEILAITGIVTDKAGDIYFLDGNRIRKVSTQ
jgi:sugar lactone lactonase YvrE